ncbi:helix-turn-helix domain-containing protein [Parvibaculum sp.]|uniref:helix-turn-helix domain-containing protein n=1 Tax=Parvibaculum sp. TaxID=2024848 RepID=UPI0027327AA7|nr:helix-turn-helix domain-containing protein [Parvibaculum sp.]MDP3329385.1 helix-turn-helix domain-containing protein [Parvibaculum sp.]
MPGLDRTGFAERLKVAMKSSGKSTKTLAEEIGTSESGVKKWRSGAADPGFGLLAHAAAVMGVSLDWLADGKGEMLSAFPPIHVNPSKAAIDPKRLALVIAAVEALFEELGGKAPPSERSELAAQLYEEVWDMDTDDEVRGGLAVAIGRERKRLRGW